MTDPAARLAVQAARRMRTIGMEVYGTFDPATDTRDLFAEAEDEAVDWWNYLGMLQQKHDIPSYDPAVRVMREAIVRGFAALGDLRAREG